MPSRSSQVTVQSVGVAWVVCLSTVLLQTSFGNDKQNAESLEPALRAKADRLILKEQSLPRSASSVIEFYAGLQRSELQQLLRHPQPEIVVRSMWEIVLRERASAQSIEQFKNTIESCTQVELPTWWKQTLRDAKFDEDVGQLKFDPRFFPDYTRRKLGWFLQDGQKLRLNDSTMFITSGSKQLEIPAEARDPSNLSEIYDSCLVAYWSGNTAYVVDYFEAYSSIPLYSINPDSSHINWKSNIWGSGKQLMRFGPTFPSKKMRSPHALTFVSGSGKICVFGASDYLMLLEIFRESDGGSIFRFCTLR